MRPPKIAAAQLPLLLILCVSRIWPCSALPAMSRRALSRGDDLIAGTDFLSVFIGASSKPRKTQNAEQSDIGLGARLAPKSTTTSTSTTPATPTQSTRSLQIPDSTYYERNHSSSKATSDDDVGLTTELSTEVATEVVPGIESSASEVEYQTAQPSDISISVVTDIVTTKEELVSLSQTDYLHHEEPKFGDQDAEGSSISKYSRTEFPDGLNPKLVDSETSASRISNVYVSHGEQTSHKPVGNSVSWFQQSSSFPSSHSWFSPNPTESTSIIVNHPSYPTQQSEPQVQQVISVRVSSSVVQGPSPVPNFSKIKPPELENRKYEFSSQGLSSANSGITQAIINSVPVGQDSNTKIVDQNLHGTPLDSQSNAESSTVDQFANEPVLQKVENQREVSKQQSEQLTSDTPTSIDSPPEAQQYLGTSLVTEDQPAATAVQRSQLSVEESSPSEIISHQEQPQQAQSPIDLHSEKVIATVVEVPNHPQTFVNYHTSVSTATSNSRVQFVRAQPKRTFPQGTISYQQEQHTEGTQNREQKSFQPDQRSEEQRRTHSFSSHGQNLQQQLHQHLQQPHLQHAQQIQLHQQQQQQQQARVQLLQHQLQQQQLQQRRQLSQLHRETPERNYELPEQNYEVDERLSVVTNGKAHGVQSSQPEAPTTEQSQAAKDAEDQGQGQGSRGLRRYRVEERTPDGFIVGEYGVVGNDGGNLLGVRYTADGAASPTLIDAALRKFLSL